MFKQSFNLIFPVYIIYLYIRIILTVYTVLNVIERYIPDICEYILSGDINIVISVGVYKDIYIKIRLYFAIDVRRHAIA